MTLREYVAIAKTPPKVDFLYFPCQTYEPKPGVWSVWGDGSFIGNTYFTAIGDHSHPGGNAFVYAYDSKSRKLKLLTDLRSVLKQPDGRYTPGKIHSELGLGTDGWLYFSTHRGSTKIAFHPTAQFKGDWILRHHRETSLTEIVAHAPLPMQCLPFGTLDPERLIFYAGTADGINEKEPQFLAYDLRQRKVLFSDPRGPARALIRAKSAKSTFTLPKKALPNFCVSIPINQPPVWSRSTPLSVSAPPRNRLRAVWSTPSTEMNFGRSIPRPKLPNRSALPRSANKLTSPASISIPKQSASSIIYPALTAVRTETAVRSCNTISKRGIARSSVSSIPGSIAKRATFRSGPTASR